MLCAQIVNFEWAKQMGGTSNETGNGVTADAAGNVYTVGNFSGTVDFDPGPAVLNFTAAATEDVFISKLDANGDLVWAKQLACNDYAFGISISADIDRNIYVTGSFAGQMDFDPGSGSFNLTSVGRQDIFIAKFDTDGNFLWAKQFGEATSFSAGNYLTTDALGNVFVTGNIANTYICIIKCDTNGNVKWEKRIGLSSVLSTGSSIITDVSGNVFTVGNFTGTVDFDPGPGIYSLSPNGNSDVFVCKLNADGDFVAAYQIGGVNLEEAHAIALDVTGNIFITGYFNGTCDFDPGPAVFNMSAYGDEDVFITKLDIAGNFVWAKQIAGALSEFGNSIVTDDGGNIYLTGYFYGTTDFDPGLAVFNIATKGSSDIFVTKLDGDGNLRWAKSMGGSLSDWSHSIFLDRTGNIYTTGYFDDVVDFDIGPGVYNLTTTGNRDIFVHKMSYCTNVTYATITVSVCKDYVLNGQTYTASGIYTQYLVNINGCDSILRLNLYVSESLTTVDKSICQGESYYAGGANQTVSGIYYDTYLTPLGCDSVIKTNLTVLPKPVPNLGRDGNLCAYNNAALITPGSFISYLWHDNSTQSGYVVSMPGKYWVTVTDINNCFATDSLTVIKIDSIPKNFLPANQQLCYGNVLKITVPDYFSYQWSTGSTNDFIDISNFGTYYLTVKDFNNCTGTDSITIQRKNCIYISIPNAFTPNGDNRNDIFRPIINQAIQKFSFIIFNRYGEKIFETYEYGKGWDGTYKGKALPTGSFVYRIKFTNINGYVSENNGTVLLIR